MHGATAKWFYCPICGQKLCRVSATYEIGKGGVYVWCKKCKNEVEVRQTA